MQGACSLSWRNNFYLMGGEFRQIRKLVDYRFIELDRKLDFDHRNGACESYGDVILLCFNYSPDDQRKCRKSLSPLGNFTEISPTSNTHSESPISCSEGEWSTRKLCKLRLTILSVSCLVVGSHYNSVAPNKKAEILNVKTGLWSTLDEYPFMV